MLRAPFLTVLLLAALSGATANAAIFNVTHFAQDMIDTNLGDCQCTSIIGGACTLRAAVMEANACPGVDTIHFANSALDQTVVLDLDGGGGAELGDLNITESVNIRGWPFSSFLPPEDADRLPIIDASALNHRIFRIENGVDVDIRGLQFSGGNFAAGSGGAIYNNGNLILRTVRFNGNTASNGGAIANMTGGVLSVTDADFVLNQASNTAQGGAALYNFGQATIRRSSFRGNRHTGNTREVIYSSENSSLIIEDSLLSGEPVMPGDNELFGIRAVNPDLLHIRNSSLIDLRPGYAAVWMEGLDGQGNIRIANSILSNQSGEGACRLDTLAGDAGDTLIDYSLVRQGASTDCAAQFGADVSDGPAPALAGFAQNVRHLNRFRMPLLNSDLRDAGNPDENDSDVALRCTATGQNGVQRPQDGDGDGTARCDLGAAEASTTTPTTFVVDTVLDAPDALPGNGVCATAAITPACSLRAAVMEANANPGADRIEFAADVAGSTLTIPGNGGADVGDLLITEQVVIAGNLVNGRPATTVDSDAGFGRRLFRIQLQPGETVRFEGLTLTGGRAAVNQHGGALLLNSNNQVTLDTVVLHDNQAGGGVNGNGGALAAFLGELVVRNADLFENTAGDWGLAIYVASGARLLMEDSSVRLHVSGDATPNPAVFVNGGLAWLRNVTLSGNENSIRAEGNFGLEVRNSSFHSDFIDLGPGVDQEHLHLDGGAGASLQVIASAFDNLSGECDVTMAAGSTRDTGNYNLSDGSCAVALGGSGNFVQPAQFRYRTAQVEGRVGRVAMPRPGSGLIDRVPDSAHLCPGQDQRGVARPVNATGQIDALCDVGAVEASVAESLPQPWVVNVYGVDLADASACDGRCDADESQPGLQCTLRAAAMESGQCGPQAYPAEILIPQAGVTLPLTIPYAEGERNATGVLTFNWDNYERRIIGPEVEGDLRPLIIASHDSGIIESTGSPLTLSNLRLAGGNKLPLDSINDGGAIYSGGGGNLLSLKNVELFDNQADEGGAIYANNSVLLERVALRGNFAASNASAIRVFGPHDLTLIDSSVTGNSVLDAGQRSAIVYGSIQNTDLVIQNSTISGNNGSGLELTSAIFDGVQFSVESSSIANNLGYGIVFTNNNQSVATRTLSLRHTLLAGNQLGGCDSSGPGWDGTYDTIGYNYSQDNGCQMAGGTNLIGVPPLLGPLQTTLAPTAFHAPLSGSPLIDGGSPDAEACPDTDQLGNARPQDGDGDSIARCNIGAIESVSAPLVDSIFGSRFED